MRHVMVVVASVAAMAAVPAPASAQDPGRIFGAMTRMLTAPLRQGLGPRIHVYRPPMDIPNTQRRAVHARTAAPDRVSAPQRASTPQRNAARDQGRAQPAPAVIATGWAGAVFWPRAADDLVGYAFFPDEAGDRFWAYGFEHITDGLFAPPAAHAFASTRRVRDDRASALPAAMTELCGSSDGASEWAVRIEQTVQPDATQRELLGHLRQAMAKADEDVKAACPTAVPTSQAARLDIMEERLRTLHYATLTIRTPLERFYQSLNDEQKARLNQSPTGSNAQAAPAALCQAHAARASDRSAFALERRARPTSEQRAYQEAMQKHLAGMAQFVASACPQDVPASPVARLDAAGDRLTVLLYAAMAMRPALDHAAPTQAPNAAAQGRTPYPRPRPAQADAIASDG